MDRHRKRRGQSLVEFAITSAVLVVLFGGLVDISRAIQFADVLHNAARQGARYGALWSEGTNSNPHLNDTAIKSAVDQELIAGGLPASVLKNSVTSPGCSLQAADGNAFSNPPYATANFPSTSNQPWLFICETAPLTAGQPMDLDVAVLMTYGPLTGFIPRGIPGGFETGTNWHVGIQR